MTLEKTMQLEVVTPEAVIFSEPVDRFQAKSPVGYFEILYNHTPYLARIDIGHIKITQRSAINFLSTSGGFVEVFRNTITVLVETAERAESIDLQRAEAAQERAKQYLKKRRIEFDIDRARISLLRAINRIKVKSL